MSGWEAKVGGFVGLPTAKEHPDKVFGLLVWRVGGRFEAWYFIEFPPPLISKAVNSHLDILHPAVFVVLVVVVCALLIFSFFFLSFLSTGYCCLHQEGVRQKIQSHMALHCWTQLWVVCDTRDAPFHLFLFGPGGHFIV